MGCGSSSGVKVEKTDQSPLKNGIKANTPNKDTFRGDRLSMVDARHRRESEIKDRRIRLSEKQINEVDKARRHSLRKGSAKDDRNTTGTSPRPSPKLNGNTHMNGSIRKEKYQLQRTPTCEIKIEHASDSDFELETELRQPKISDIQEHPTREGSPPNHRNDDSSLQTKMVFEESPNPRQSDDLRNSVDSLDLKKNANDFVNDILSKALSKIENDKNTSSRRDEEGTMLVSERTASQNNSIAIETTSVDEHAKNIVNAMLINAVMQVRNDGNNIKNDSI